METELWQIDTKGNYPIENGQKATVIKCPISPATALVQDHSRQCTAPHLHLHHPIVHSPYAA